MKTEELIEAYFSRQLEVKEIEELKERLQNDLAAKDEFLFQLELSKIIKEKEKIKIKERLTRLEQQAKPQKATWWIAAASIAMLFTIAWALGLLPSINNQGNQLYSEYFQAYPNVISPLERSKPTEGQTQTEAAFKYYDHQQYSKAILEFNQIYSADSSEYALFYSAVSSLGNSDFQTAIQQLEQKKHWDNADFEIVSNWYLALAYLKLENTEEAIKHLNKVENTNHSLSKSATKLIEDLN